MVTVLPPAIPIPVSGGRNVRSAKADGQVLQREEKRRSSGRVRKFPQIPEQRNSTKATRALVAREPEELLYIGNSIE